MIFFYTKEVFILNQLDRFILNILNLETKNISSIESTKNDEGKIIAHIVLHGTSDNCTYCDSKNIVSKGYRKVTLNTYSINSETCNITCSIKRYQCRECNKSFSDNFHMSPSHSRVTYSIILKVMDLLKNPSMTFKSVGEILALSPQTVMRIFDKYCKLSHIKLPEVICIDEVYTKNSDFDNSKYSCIIYDFFDKTIVDITPSRKKSFLLNYLETTYSKDERDNVKFVCIDMYKPYKDIIKLRFKNAIICIDNFHVIKSLNDCVNSIRMRILRSYDNSSIEYYLLKKWKFLLFSLNINLDNIAKYNKKLRRYINYRQLLELMLKIHPDLEKAYHIKNDYIMFNATCNDVAEALDNIHSFYDRILLSDIEEFIPFITILGNWDIEIANSFTYLHGRRISNGIAESINSKVSTVLFNSKGIRNSNRRKKRIMYVVNHNSVSL